MFIAIEVHEKQDDGVAADLLDLLVQLPGLGRTLIARPGKLSADSPEPLGGGIGGFPQAERAGRRVGS